MPTPARAWNSLAAQARFWLVAVLGVGIDLWSKEWAFRTLGQGGRRVLIPHVLEFQTMMNDGALFGIGSGRTGIFLVASGLALVLVLWMFSQSPARRWSVQIALGAILAGALGNMYDRATVRLVAWKAPGQPLRYYERQPGPDGETLLLREYPADVPGLEHTLPASAAAHLPEEVGYVRDFIKIPTKLFGDRDLWPWVFNVADMLLVGGVGLLAWRMFRQRDPEPDAAGGTETASG